MPEPVADWFEAALFLNAERNAQLVAGIVAATRALNAEGIEPLLLKGSGLLVGEIYPHPGMRFAGDIDLLLPEDRVEEARQCLIRAGFRRTDEADDPERHQLPMLVHPETAIGIELHRHPITRALMPLADGRGVLSRAAPIEHDGAAMLLPAPTDRVLLAIAHGQLKDRGFERGVPPLRAMLDVALHQQLFADAIDWREIERRFAGAGEPGALYDLLVLAGALMRMETPLALPGTGAVERLRATLDRSAPRKTLGALAGLARALPKALTRAPAEQRAALSGERWRARMARYHPKW